MLKYKKILLKISGEQLGRGPESFNYKIVEYITKQVKVAHHKGVKIGMVVGGGNIIRGGASREMDRIDADHCGMMATIINGLVLHAFFKKEKIKSVISSAIEIPGLIRKANPDADRSSFNEGCVVIFVGGTGNPLFTTDTAAALRAAELNVDILIKGTKVKGVYSADPMKQKNAVFYPALDFTEAIKRELKVMDLTAFRICQEASTPVYVYDFLKYPLLRIVKGDRVGTLITMEEK